MEVLVQLADYLTPIGLLVAVIVYLLLRRRQNSGSRSSSASSCEDEVIHTQLSADIETIATTANHNSEQISARLSSIQQRLDSIGKDIAEVRQVMFSHLEQHSR